MTQGSPVAAPPEPPTPPPAAEVDLFPVLGGGGVPGPLATTEPLRIPVPADVDVAVVRAFVTVRPVDITVGPPRVAAQLRGPGWRVWDDRRWVPAPQAGEVWLDAATLHPERPFVLMRADGEVSRVQPVGVDGGRVRGVAAVGYDGDEDAWVTVVAAMLDIDFR